MKKGLMIGGGVVVILIAAGAYFLFSNLGSIIKAAVESFGTEITQAKVELNSVDLSPTDGAGAMRGLTIGNPAGFKTDSAFKLGEISLKVDTSTLTSDVIVIHEIRIIRPEVTYELGDGGSNVDAIQRNVDSYLKAQGIDPNAKGESKSSGEGPKLIIENLYIQDGKVRVSAGFLKGKTLDSPLPNLHLKDIGKEEKGASPGEVAKKIMDSMTSGITTAIKPLNLDATMKAASDLLKSGTGGLKTGAESVTDSVSEGAAGATKALKGLLGGD